MFDSILFNKKNRGYLKIYYIIYLFFYNELKNEIVAFDRSYYIKMNLLSIISLVRPYLSYIDLIKMYEVSIEINEIMKDEMHSRYNRGIYEIESQYFIECERTNQHRSTGTKDYGIIYGDLIDRILDGDKSIYTLPKDEKKFEYLRAEDLSNMTEF